MEDALQRVRRARGSARGGQRQATFFGQVMFLVAVALYASTVAGSYIGRSVTAPSRPSSCSSPHSAY